MFKTLLSVNTILSPITFSILYMLSIFTSSVSLYVTFVHLIETYIHSDYKSKIYPISLRSRFVSFFSALMFSTLSFDPLHQFHLIPTHITKPLNLLWHLTFTLWVIIILQITYTTIKFIETNLAYKLNTLNTLLCYIPPFLLSIVVMIVAVIRKYKLLADHTYKMYKISFLVVVGVLNLSLVLSLAGILVILFRLVTENAYTSRKAKIMIRKWKVFMTLLLILNVMYCFFGVVMIEKLLDENFIIKDKENNENNEFFIENNGIKDRFIIVNSNEVLYLCLRIFGMFVQVYFGMIYKGTKKIKSRIY